MNNQKLSEDNILIYLEDLGLDQEMIDLYLKSEYAHDLKSQIQILRKHRCILITVLLHARFAYFERRTI